ALPPRRSSRAGCLWSSTWTLPNTRRLPSCREASDTSHGAIAMKVKNLTPFLFGYRVTSRRPPRPEVALVARATCLLRHGAPLAVADELDQGAMSCELFAPGDDDRRGECLYPGDFADYKLRAEVMLRGAAHAPGGRPVTELPVRFAVGGWSKILRVVGPRS